MLRLIAMSILLLISMSWSQGSDEDIPDPDYMVYDGVKTLPVSVPEKAVLVILRPNRVNENDEDSKYYLNENLIGALQGGSYLVDTVEPGQYNLTCESDDNWETYPVHMAAGTVSFVMTYVWLSRNYSGFQTYNESWPVQYDIFKEEYPFMTCLRFAKTDIRKRDLTINKAEYYKLQQNIDRSREQVQLFSKYRGYKIIPNTGVLYPLYTKNRMTCNGEYASMNGTVLSENDLYRYWCHNAAHIEELNTSQIANEVIIYNKFIARLPDSAKVAFNIEAASDSTSRKTRPPVSIQEPLEIINAVEPETKPLRTIVFHLTSENLDTPKLTLIYNKLLSELETTTRFDISGQAAIEGAMQANPELSAKCPSVECAKNVGQFFSSPIAISGTVTQTDTGYALAFKFYDMQYETIKVRNVKVAINGNLDKVLNEAVKLIVQTFVQISNTKPIITPVETNEAAVATLLPAAPSSQEIGTSTIRTNRQEQAPTKIQLGITQQKNKGRAMLWSGIGVTGMSIALAIFNDDVMGLLALPTIPGGGVLLTFGIVNLAKASAGEKKFGKVSKPAIEPDRPSLQNKNVRITTPAISPPQPIASPKVVGVVRLENTGTKLMLCGGIGAGVGLGVGAVSYEVTYIKWINEIDKTRSLDPELKISPVTFTGIGILGVGTMVCLSGVVVKIVSNVQKRFLADAEPIFDNVQFYAGLNSAGVLVKF